MIKRLCICICIILNVTLLFSSKIMALGLGGYITGSYSYYNWSYTNTENNKPTLGPSFKDKSDGYKKGIGFMLDTAVAMNFPVNYRLHVGFASVQINNATTTGTDKDLPNTSAFEFHLYNDFGIGVIRNKNFRIWVGPQFGFGFDASNLRFEGYSYYSFFYSIGAVAGMNYNIGRIFTFTIDGGLRYSHHGAQRQYDSETYITWDVTGHAYEAFINIGFLCRIRDIYINNSHDETNDSD